MKYLLCLSLLISFETLASPRQCFESALRILSPGTAIKICRGARDDSPVRCFESSWQRLGPSVATRICTGAREVNGPASCFDRVVGLHGHSIASILCQGAVESEIDLLLECFTDARRAVDPGAAAKLCSDFNE